MAFLELCKSENFSQTVKHQFWSMLQFSEKRETNTFFDSAKLSGRRINHLTFLFVYFIGADGVAVG